MNGLQNLSIAGAALRLLCLIAASLLCPQNSLAAACNGDFTTIYHEAAPAVARIHATIIDPFRVVNRVKRNIAAGVFISEKRIVTNAHTVWGASIIGVAANDEYRVAAVVGADPISDIAVIEITEAIAGTTLVRWGDSDALDVGQDVMAIGHPIALTASASRGIISGTSRILPISPLSWLTPLIQTDAATFPGSSGGPLIDRCGGVVGLNSLIIQGRSGINFAVPSNIVRKIADEIIEKKRVVRPWHGIHGRTIDATLRPILEVAHGMSISHGFLIETVEPGSPARKAGLVGGILPVNVNGEEYLLGGEIITAVNGTVLDSIDTVVAVARSLKVGQRVKLQILKNGTNHTIELLLRERPVLQGDVRRFR
jgi:S1-C subfamily serine protease